MGSPNKKWVRMDTIDSILEETINQAERNVDELKEAFPNGRDGTVAQLAYLHAFAYLSALRDFAYDLWRREEDIVAIGQVEKVED